MALLGLAIPALIYVAAVARVFPFEVDDSYISFRYASNLATGHGLVFNAGGSHLEGYTNLLLVLIEAALFRIGVRILWPVKLLLAVSGLATLAMTIIYGWRQLRIDASSQALWWLPPLAGFLTATSVPFILWTAGGLETVLFSFLCLAGIVCYLLWLNGETRVGTIVAVDLVFFLATLARPEGLLFWAITTGHTAVAGLLWDRRLLSRPRVTGMLLGLLLLVGYGLWKWSYFGQLLPATYLAKHPAWELGTVVEGSRRLWAFLTINGNAGLAVLLLAGIGLAVRRRTAPQASAWYLVAILAAYLAYVLSLGYSVAMDDAYRFYVPLIPVLSLALLELARTWRPAMMVHKSAWLTGSLVVVAFLLPQRLHDLQTAWTDDLNWGALQYRVAARDVASGLRSGHIALGLWLREHAPHDANIVLYDAGAIPYFSGLNTIDTWSLTDPQLITLNRSLEMAANDADREQIRAEMRSYVLEQDPEYIIEDGISLLRDPAVRAHYRQIGESFVYMDWYLCDRQRSCRYVLEPWQRQDVP